jgi:rod shape-determining protein MreC
MRRTSLAFGLGLLVCAVFVAWHYIARRGGSGGLSMPEKIALASVRGPQRGFSSAGSWLGDVGRAVIARDSIIGQNRNLQARVDSLEGENTRLRRYLKENQDLRALLKMPTSYGGDNVPADVVGVDFTDYARLITLNIGPGQSVRPKDMVFTSRGLVGQVFSTGGGPLPASQVLLLNDRNSSVGAMTQRTMAKGWVRGTGDGCTMELVSFEADVREGDLVVTSGDSAIFPRGVVIGRVLKVRRNKTYSTQSAEVEPAVAFDRLSAVFVRTKAGP